MSINSVNQQTNEILINNQNTDEKIKTNLSKALESGGISGISYVGKENSQKTVSDAKDNLSANLLTEDPKKTESMVSSLCCGLSASELKGIGENAMGALKGITNLAAQISTTAPESNTSPTTVDNLLKNSDLSLLDIRGLMKLLIQAFSQFFTTQRSLDLNTINQIEAAMEAKISAMEKEKDEAYKAAMSSAIGSIVAGAVSVCAGVVSCVGGALSACGKTIKDPQAVAGTAAGATRKVISQDGFAKAGAIVTAVGKTVEGFSNISSGVAGIFSANYQSNEKDAQIEQTKQDAVLEILKKMQNDGSDQTKQLMDFISRLLSMIQELQQSAAQTEKTIVQA